MDRKLLIEQDGATLAQLTFTYNTPTNANVRIEVNRIIELQEGIKTTTPLYVNIVDIEHEALSTIADVEVFDRVIFAEQVKEAEGITDLEFIYRPVHYRYTVGEQTTEAIVDIIADFAADKKELVLVSALNIGHDITASGSSLETNMDFIKRICGDGSNAKLVDIR